MTKFVLKSTVTGRYFRLTGPKDSITAMFATKFSFGTKRQAESVMKLWPEYKIVVIES